MKITVLVDNTPADNLRSEWGLSFLIEYKDKKFLLDTGSSSLFLENADKMGISLLNVDYAILSHAHFDHSNGFDAFFNHNHNAMCFMQEACRLNNCYHQKFIFDFFVGIRRSILKKYAERIKFVKGDYKITDDVYLISHNAKDNYLIGKREKMYTHRGLHRFPDDFMHEQSLVFDTNKGLVIMNSCSHAGAANIISEVMEYFPGRNVYAMIGGFHLFNKTDEEVKMFASQLKNKEVTHIYTGHCTGNKAYQILKEELEDRICQLKCGLNIEL